MQDAKIAGCLVVAIALAAAGQVAAQFNPPRIAYKINTTDDGLVADSLRGLATYYVDRGLETSINRGDVLNVYREKRLARGVQRPLRLFIGTMVITDSQPGASMGRFKPNDAALSHPLIRHRAAMKGDLVVPVLVIDSGVLFDPGQASLKPAAQQEFTKVADFVNMFSPNKLVIEGHTDSDGDEDANQMLSKQRAQAVVDYLVLTYNFITPAMIESRGYGETRPVVNNDTPENKALNRRIEVLVWE
ncbi:OmpA family protein [Candidatus Latescibacterota bacterium]